ncbi:hypothetical protein [Sphingobacterium sp. UME9]|uniref:hypothetical protein n=1 Tax=Sphingobacterium sp. UME9 TaxID=1862316 RepID=UPI001C81B66E|nr:hypothetical protein [Sphingobacterium sp. UME9]
MEAFRSQCDQDGLYKRVNFNELLRDIDKYDGQFVEIKGKYISGFEESALYGNNTFYKNSPQNGLWILFDSFNLKCPLRSINNKGGKLLTDSDLQNRTILLHGRVDKRNKGHLALYKGALIDITLVEIE